MKKPQDEITDELRPEYDIRELLRTGIRGRYAERYKADRMAGTPPGHKCQGYPKAPGKPGAP